MAKPTAKTARAGRRARKDDFIKFRVTEAEKEALDQAAQKSGLALSAWLRQLALRAAGVLPQPESEREG
jgi:uncharacterized protein (DUF1778 family)